jgi:hypothetical protein
MKYSYLFLMLMLLLVQCAEKKEQKAGPPNVLFHRR